MNDIVSGFSVRSYMRVTRERWRWIVGGGVFGLGVALLLLQLVPATYTATAVVNVEVVSTSLFRTDRPASSVIDMQTEAAIAGSYSVAVRASKNLDGVLSAKAIRPRTSVAVDSGGTIMRVKFEDTDPERARDVADEIAQAYLEVRYDKAQERAAQTRKSIDERLSVLTEDLKQAHQDVAASKDGTPARASAEADAALVRAEIDGLVSERVSLFNLSQDVGQLITPASATSMDVSPSRPIVQVAGLLAGLMGGLVLAFARERGARSIDSRTVLENLVLVPVWTADDNSPNDWWGTARELFAHAINKHRSQGDPVVGVSGTALHDPTSVVVLGNDQQTFAVAEHLVDDVKSVTGADAVELLPLGVEQSAILAALRKAGAAALVVPSKYRKSALMSLLQILEQMDVELLGIVFIERSASAPKKSGDQADASSASLQ